MNDVENEANNQTRYNRFKILKQGQLYCSSHCLCINLRLCCQFILPTDRSCCVVHIFHIKYYVFLLLITFMKSQIHLQHSRLVRLEIHFPIFIRQKVKKKKCFHWNSLLYRHTNKKKILFSHHPLKKCSYSSSSQVFCIPV